MTKTDLERFLDITGAKLKISKIWLYLCNQHIEFVLINTFWQKSENFFGFLVYFHTKMTKADFWQFLAIAGAKIKIENLTLFLQSGYRNCIKKNFLTKKWEFFRFLSFLHTKITKADFRSFLSITGAKLKISKIWIYFCNQHIQIV